jgi:hypothetical protein
MVARVAASQAVAVVVWAGLANMGADGSLEPISLAIAEATAAGVEAEAATAAVSVAEMAAASVA